MISLKLVVLCAFLAAVKSQSVQLEPYFNPCNSSEFHADNYLDAHRRQFLANIWIYDYKIDNFKILYNERINILTLQQTLLLNTLAQTYENLIPMELINDHHRNCVEKYRNLIPPMAAVKYNMQMCAIAATNQLNSLIANPSNTNRTLQTYYTTNFENAIKTCQKNYGNLNLNYTLCVQNAVATANTYTINNQKTFDTQMDTSTNSANYYVKKAIECSFDVHNTTIASITQANTLIDRCIRGLDYCNRCTGYYCDNVFYLPASTIDPRNRSMTNVFYGSNHNVKCLMLDVY